MNPLALLRGNQNELRRQQEELRSEEEVGAQPGPQIAVNPCRKA